MNRDDHLLYSYLDGDRWAISSFCREFESPEPAYADHLPTMLDWPERPNRIVKCEACNAASQREQEIFANHRAPVECKWAGLEGYIMLSARHSKYTDGTYAIRSSGQKDYETQELRGPAWFARLTLVGGKGIPEYWKVDDLAEADRVKLSDIARW